MNDAHRPSVLWGQSADRDRLLLFCLAATLAQERAPWELILALVYIAM